MAALKIIDARSPQAKDMRLRKAHFGLDGKVIGGEDMLTQNRVLMPAAPRNMGSPRPSFMPDLLAEHKARQPQRNDSHVSAYRDTLRQQATGARVGEAVAAERAKRTPGAEPLKVVDMRPSRQQASADRNPHGMAYLDKLGDVMREQTTAEMSERATGTPRDYSKAGVHYARDEAERRASGQTNPSIVRLPVNAHRAVLTDPKYGGSGVAYATPGPRTEPRPEGVRDGMRAINQMARTSTAPKLPQVALPRPSLTAKTGSALTYGEIEAETAKPKAAPAPLEFTEPNRDADGYRVANGQRYGRTGLPMYGPSTEEITRKVRGFFSR